MVIVTKCAHCGAQIRFIHGTEITKCSYCDSLNVIESKRVDVTSSQKKGIQLDDITKQLGEIFSTRELTKPELTFAANHVVGSNAQGGQLWITDREVFFKPHQFNFGDLSKRYVKLSDIIGYEKGPLTDLTLKTKKGDMLLAVWEKDDIINIIEHKKKKLEALGELDESLSNSEVSNASSLENYNSTNNIGNGKPSWLKRLMWPIIFFTIAIILKVLVKCNAG